MATLSLSSRFILRAFGSQIIRLALATLFIMKFAMAAAVFGAEQSRWLDPRSGCFTQPNPDVACILDLSTSDKALRLVGLGLIYRNQSKYDKDRPTTVDSLRQLTRLFSRPGRRAGAESLLKEALQIHHNHPLHLPGLAQTLNDLARLYIDSGRRLVGVL
jgi:hypothetical protein